MKITQLIITNVAGYHSIEWNNLQPDLNFLVGANGAGKSTILQAMFAGLNYINGSRKADLLLRSYPEGRIEIYFSKNNQPRIYQFNDMLVTPPRPKPNTSVGVLYEVENRQPKNTMGVDRNTSLQHPSNRYPNTVSELKQLMKEGSGGKELAGRVIQISEKLSRPARPEHWAWIRKEIGVRSQNKARPVSCGQFDIIALVLDVLRFKEEFGGQDSIFVLLDNPETYIHPSCQEPIIQFIREELPNAQIFISSHSLKLLCYRDPKAVFWIDRGKIDTQGNITIKSIRSMDGGAKKAFFDLYGDDVSAAVLQMVQSFESPEYYKFLCECALPAKVEARKFPRQDRQIMEVVAEYPFSAQNWKVLDFAAGHGDLLEGILYYKPRLKALTYIAYTIDIPQSPYLARRINDAIERGIIASDSSIVDSLSRLPQDCDVINLLNVCHEILLPELSKKIGLLLKCLKNLSTSKLIIHEMETLLVGEKRFLMWTPEDYQCIFGAIDYLQVSSKLEETSGVPLNTTVVSFKQDNVSIGNIEELLLDVFYQLLPSKKTKYLEEIEVLHEKSMDEVKKLDEYLRQRRLAYLTAQVATICQLEKSLAR